VTTVSFLISISFDFFENEDIACEAASLTTLNPNDGGRNAALRNLIVLVSPGNFQQRSEKYGELPNCKVNTLHEHTAQ
jgi:hypothetical protein